MRMIDLAANAAETVGLLLLSPLTVPAIGKASRPVAKAIIKAGLAVHAQWRTIFDEIDAELKKETPTLLSIGKQMAEELISGVAESLIEGGAEGEVEASMGETIEEVATAAVEAML